MVDQVEGELNWQHQNVQPVSATALPQETPLPNQSGCREAVERAHITYGIVRHRPEAMNDPQLLANDIIVPLDGASEDSKLTARDSEVIR
jgi:hypothetical protein